MSMDSTVPVERATTSYDNGDGLVIDISMERVSGGDPRTLPNALGFTLDAAMQTLIPGPEPQGDTPTIEDQSEVTC